MTRYKSAFAVPSGFACSTNVEAAARSANAPELMSQKGDRASAHASARGRRETKGQSKAA